MFVGSELISGDLVVDGCRVDPGAIECPLSLLTGARDHITPPAQLFAFADAVGTPADDVVRRTAPGGHLGLFMGHAALRTEWPELASQIREGS